MLRKCFIFAIALGSAFMATVGATAASASVAPNPAAPYCQDGTTIQSDSRALAYLTSHGVTVFETFDWFPFYAPDYDNDPGDTGDDSVITAGACFVSAPPLANDGWVASGTAPFGEIQPRTCPAIQQLLDGTYPGIDGVYRTPIATRNADGSWSLSDHVLAGYKLDGRAVGGDFTDPHAATFPVNQGIVDRHSVLPGQLTACVYFTAVKG